MGAWQTVRDRLGARQRDTQSKAYQGGGGELASPRASGCGWIKNGGRFDTRPTVRMGAWQTVRYRLGARQRDTHSKAY